jgi:hypothetical protein
MAASEQPTGQMKPAPGSAASEEREKSRRIGSLRALGPFLAPYKAMLAAAFAALVLTAVVSLTLPLAVRRVVDGFETSSTELLDKYFLALLGVAIVFAGGAALRFYLVTRLGERVVADIRKAVFDRMIGMSPAFYERIMTGEVLSRITTDTTLLLSVISSSVSIALRNCPDPDRRDRVDVLHLAETVGAGPADRAGRDHADRRAGPPPARAQPRKPGLDRRKLGQRVRGAVVGADGAGLHP